MHLTACTGAFFSQCVLYGLNVQRFVYMYIWSLFVFYRLYYVLISLYFVLSVYKFNGLYLSWMIVLYCIIPIMCCMFMCCIIPNMCRMFCIILIICCIIRTMCCMFYIILTMCCMFCIIVICFVMSLYVSYHLYCVLYCICFVSPLLWCVRVYSLITIKCRVLSGSIVW